MCLRLLWLCGGLSWLKQPACSHPQRTTRTASTATPLQPTTLHIAAPEQLLGMPCTTKADVYSLGVLLTVLCTGRPLAARGQLCLPTAPADCPQVRWWGGVGWVGCG